jgi:hypothetical protein
MKYYFDRIPDDGFHKSGLIIYLPELTCLPPGFSQKATLKTGVCLIYYSRWTDGKIKLE